ncbi:MAG TPA: acetyl-CoA hydrolase/transferase C-terminal domain-containing protein [Coprothermobacter proteolyticus]|nr:acetyl-CoA hydrolase/transferase C-terminal domain-containing protein [Coprothermobacter proteolyticus]
MDYKETYKQKLLDIEGVLSKVKSGDSIVVGMAAAEPVGLLSNLHLIRDRVRDVTVVSCLLLKDYEYYKYVDKQDSPFRSETWYLGEYERALFKEGKSSYIPNNLHMAASDRIQAKEINIYSGSATPMDSRGYMSLSLGNVYEKDILEHADTVILEINGNLPRTHGDTVVHINDVDFIYEYNAPLIEVPSAEASEVDKRIGEFIADLIEDGATIQLGIGGIPNAIAQFLVDKKDLGLHTELMTEGVVDLIEAGVITNSQKTLWKDKCIASFVMGTKRLYDFVDNNLAVEVHRGRIVNDPYVVAKNKKMVSVNTALSVDLTGQVCSEAFGPQQYTGTGGQLDMHRGAIMSEGGKAIIAMRSSVKNNTISTVVPTLAPGSFVTVPRHDVDYIITEYGVAHLRGKSLRERAVEMIEIAHPDFRDWLRMEAKKFGFI